MSSHVPEIEIKETLENILAEQMNRLFSTGSIKKDEMNFIITSLQNSRLMPEQIENDLTKELEAICSYRYDDAMLSSNRHGGFGWSLQHMQEHMERFLKLKLQKISTILRTKGL